MKLAKFNDDRILKAGLQFLFAVFIIAVFASMYGNTVRALTNRGMLPSFKFLSLAAGIDIGEHIIPFDNSSSNFRAIVVGLLNTISISIVVILFSTLLGFFIALFRLSTNWLLKNIALAYIEIIRNIPLLVLLLFWYRAVFMEFPRLKEAIVLGRFVTPEGITGGKLFLSNRGLSMLWPVPGETWHLYRHVLLAGLLAAGLLMFFLDRKGRKTGRKPLILLHGLLAFLGTGFLGWLILPAPPLVMSYPLLKGFNLAGGLNISSEWGSLFSGLILYTSAYIAEAIRAGIQAVDKGQLEAAQSLGFSRFKTIRLVILPQALRITVPPLTSIYLGVAKNTSLGVAIGFPDLFSVIGTLINQSGRALELILVVMAIYLGLSLTTSLFMNIYNSRIQLKEK